ncbi:hypothetical protein [Flavimaricola marinus]|uniref:Lipoprotein n=1 Tax=Flavimaricola marinus TaxID=1819565 RepID=A0A238LD42_9RHOB|nr:hypothetical protein [Flavimaricola marinus]SMY06840.1 hypothetical protein LOM8899_00970 [Flavimaricola marinus]
MSVDLSKLSRRAVLAGIPLTLAGCGAPSVWADDEMVSRSIYRHDGPPSLSLFTMKNVGTDNGAHSGLMINASQRVIFDPAGTFENPLIAERNDVVFGITPTLLDIYRSYHARSTYYVIEQAAPVSAEAAETALQLAFAAGPVGKARCTYSIAAILNQLPGVAGFRTTLFPDNLQKQFAKMPGVETTEYREYDPDNKDIAMQSFADEIAAEVESLASDR